MTLLTADRDALAKALHEHRNYFATQDGHRECYCGRVLPLSESYERHVTDALLAAGAVIDAATLADDEKLVDRLARAIADADGEALERTNFEFLTATYDEQAGAALRALAAALTERGEQP